LPARFPARLKINKFYKQHLKCNISNNSVKLLIITVRFTVRLRKIGKFKK